MEHWFPQEWSHIRLGKNALIEWIVAAGVVVLVAIVTRAAQGLLSRRLAQAVAKTATHVDDIIVNVFRGTRLSFHIALGVLVAQNFIDLPAATERFVRVALSLILAFQVGVWVNRAAVGVIGVWATGRDRGQQATMAAGLGFLARFVIWTMVLLIALSNLGIKLSAVIAGLGVGGVAAALAVQSTLGDLIAGVSMYFDRPFDIGDSVAIDSLNGTITRIGAKTTRILSVNGEEIIVPNGDIAKSRIRNFARLRERRVVFKFNVGYGLPAEKIERAVVLVREVLGRREGIRLDRAHFVALGATTLEFEVVYFVPSPDYKVYLDHQQAINLDLYRAFETEGILFLSPPLQPLTPPPQAPPLQA